MVRAETGVVVLPRLRRGHEALGVGDVVRPAHADEAAGLEAHLPAAQGQGLEEDGDVVRVAGDDLHETLVGALHLVVDAARVRLAEAELGALGEESLRPAAALVVLGLVFVAGRRAVDDDGGPVERLLGGEGDAVAEPVELVARMLVDDELSAAPDQMLDHGVVFRFRSALVERDLVDAPLRLEIGEESDERLADGSRTNDVDDCLVRHNGRGL